MSLFEPYSHTRLQELRQEQLARKARRLAASSTTNTTGHALVDAISQGAHALSSRLAHPRGRTTPRRPALDS